MGQELTGAGFLRQGARFVDDESFLEIGPGMAKLIRVLTRSRGGTKTDPISIPFRHGTLHGVDLNYHNPLVAAKAWAALFAGGCYAKSVEDTQTPKPEQAGFVETWSDITRTMAHTKRQQELGDAWRPRSGDEIEASLSSQKQGTPESTIIELLENWRRRNYGALAKLVLDSRKEPLQPLAGRIRRNLPEAPSRFTLISVEDSAPAAASVAVGLEWSGFTYVVQLRLLYNDASGIVPSNSNTGGWLVASLWPLEAVRLAIAASNRGVEADDPA